jgi:HEAT repeat protein
MAPASIDPLIAPLSNPKMESDGGVRKRVQTALAVLLVAIAGVVAVQVLRPKEPEPVYQGKTLRVWLAQCEHAWAKQDGKSQDEAEVAIARIGTNAIPTLLNMLSKEDSLWVTLWQRHIARVKFLPAWVRSPAWYRNRPRVLDLHMQALKGFEALRFQNVQQVAPDLIRIYERTSSADSQRCVIESLMAIGPEAARQAIPSILRNAVSSDTRVRQTTIVALAQIHAEPSMVVPVLVRSLGDTDATIRGTAALGLRDFGRESRQAVPVLVLLINDPDAGVRRCAREALKTIDYEAAVKAGVKFAPPGEEENERQGHPWF